VQQRNGTRELKIRVGNKKKGNTVSFWLSGKWREEGLTIKKKMSKFNKKRAVVFAKNNQPAQGRGLFVIWINKGWGSNLWQLVMEVSWDFEEPN